VREIPSFLPSRLLTPLLLILAIIAAPSPARGQAAPQPQPQPQYPPGNEFALWGGYSFANPQMIGIETNRQLGVIALRYARTLYDKPHSSLQYTLDVVPVETVRQYSYQVCTPTPGQISYCPNGRETVYGGGVNPIGLKLNFLRVHRYQPFIASTAGFVASVRPVPVDIPGGTQFNFTFDFQVGMDLFNSSRNRAWRVGYKYQHISNAYRHDYNPGVDFQLVFLSYSFFK
jgi:Lipid A 3-O-deacylase (PagL)